VGPEEKGNPRQETEAADAGENPPDHSCVLVAADDHEWRTDADQKRAQS
jgi:hypothetical protein